MDAPSATVRAAKPKVLAPDAPRAVAQAAAPPSRAMKPPVTPGGVAKLPAKIARARDALLSPFRPILAAHGLTDSQWRVLRVLSSVEEIDAGDTARRAFLLPSSLSRILKDFNARGLIASWAAPDDARRSMHALTDSGRALVSEIEPHLMVAHHQIAQKIGVDRLQALAEMLDAFSDDLES